MYKRQRQLPACRSVLEALGSPSAGVRALDVDNKRPCADKREDDLLRLVARVDIAMNQPRRYVEEPARLHVRALAAAWPELEPGAAADDVAEHISIAVVVPAGRDAALRACTHEHRPRRVERELTDESRRRRSRCQTVGAQGSYSRTSTVQSDAARLQLAETLAWASVPECPPKRRRRVSLQAYRRVMLRRVLSRLLGSGRSESMEATVANAGRIPDHESAVRRMLADAHGRRYDALESLDEAKATADAAVVMRGDYGGSIYLTCPARIVQCDESTLRQLLHDLDGHDWDDPEGAGLYFEVAPVGSGVAGGTGGGAVTDGVWLHPDLEAMGLRDRVERVITGRHPRLG